MTETTSNWPVLRSFSGDHLERVNLPLGGIGTGTIGLGGRGDLRSWEIRNEPAHDFAPTVGFFALHADDGAGLRRTRVLEAQLTAGEVAGAFGSRAASGGLPRFASATFSAAYPLAQVALRDPALPLEVTLEAFNPLVPGDADLSGIPAAVLRYRVTNRHHRALAVSVCGSVDNIAGQGGLTAWSKRRPVPFHTARNTVRTHGPALGVDLRTDWPRDDPAYGSLALLLLDPVSPSHRTGWLGPGFGRRYLLDFWDDLHADGTVSTPPGAVAPVASLADTRPLAPGGTTTFTYVLAWHFPNRRAWAAETSEAIEFGRLGEHVIGNHYATRHADAWDVATTTLDRLDELERRTVAFVRAVTGMPAPPEVLDAALSNLTGLRSETCFRDATGRFFGWEGIGPDAGSCFGNCTHVWNYDLATPFLFGPLSRSLRDTEFAHATADDGLMSFRVGLPLSTHARAWRVAAADGQLGALVKLYRDWRLSGDDALLARLWPRARAALEYVWLPGGWDGDQDGVMEGIQHNTMDVEYVGPNPQMQGWYLAALTACARMAAHAGEHDLAARCRKLADGGRAWTDEHLFDGRYYRHEIRPYPADAPVLEGVQHPNYANHPGTPQEPEFQLGDGCLVDQLVGQVAAHTAGLGHVLDPGNVRTAAVSVATLNHVSPMRLHANPMRVYATGEDSALVMAAYPPGVERPRFPFPYFSEVMTGFEYTAAASLMYEGYEQHAARIVADVRARYDGRTRNPFDEAECGRHYARALASWGVLLAWLGLDWDGRTGVLSMRSLPGSTRIWMTGDAWGTLEEGEGEAVLHVHEGSLPLTGLRLGDRVAPHPGPRVTRGESVRLDLGTRQPL